MNDINVFCFTDANILPNVIIALGVVSGVFFVGFVVAVVYLICTRRKQQGKTNRCRSSVRLNLTLSSLGTYRLICLRMLTVQDGPH